MQLSIFYLVVNVQNLVHSQPGIPAELKELIYKLIEYVLSGRRRIPPFVCRRRSLAPAMLARSFEVVSHYILRGMRRLS